MKPEELRIGNFYKKRYYKEEWGENLHRVSSLPIKPYFVKKDDWNKSTNSGDPEGIDINEIQPIPLTEEWMLRFGFEKTATEFCYGNGKIGVFFYKGEASYDISKMRYVHQLQNLYFALTGEELKLIT